MENTDINPTCVREVANWSKLKKEHKFEKKEFDERVILNDLATSSPKAVELIKKINELNEMDQKEHGKQFKHVIFSEVKKGYGAKVIASALIASGYHFALDKKMKLNLESNGKPSFLLLSSTQLYDSNYSKKLGSQVTNLFNERPGNIFGQKAQIMILDGGFKEGLDLFDVKYVHIFEPPESLSDRKQVIGRATRMCGQKGLPFIPGKGWSLYVYVYDVMLNEWGYSYSADTLHSLYMSALNLDPKINEFANELNTLVRLGSIDYDLNKNIHNFQPSSSRSTRDILMAAATAPLPELKNNPLFSINSVTEDMRNMSLSPKDVQFDLIENDEIALKKFKHSDIYRQIRKEVRKNYALFAWPKAKLENLCEGDNHRSGTEFTPTQSFLRNYFTPSSELKGMLLYHSTGTGKTCTAIATASSSFETEGYTILWVTRTTLKEGIWKNMFEQVCSMVIREKLQNGEIKITESMTTAQKKRLLSKSWSIQPISYKTLSNILQKKNKYYQKLVDKNGKKDPLRKTLLIIDEAHKLYSGSDLSTTERPDMDVIKKGIFNSYKVSGKDSVKTLLMTATPYTTDPMDMIKLINLLNKNIPEDFKVFSKEYLDEKGSFTVQGGSRFLNEIAGHISYLNRERDPRSFAIPLIRNVNVDVTQPEVSTQLDLQDEKKKEIKAITDEIDNAIDKLQMSMMSIDEKRINKAKLKLQLKEEKLRITNKYKALREQQKNDISQLSTLESRCFISKQ